MSIFLRNLGSVFYSALRFVLLKIIYRKRFRFKGLQRFSPRTQLFMMKGGSIYLGNKVRAHSGTKLRSVAGATLKVGDNVTFNYDCFIVSLKEISIGSGTEFGPNVLVYDHDHDFRVGLKKGNYKKSSVEIGSNCWIGANSIILRGTKLGKNCVVGAGSIISGSFPDNSIITQKRETEIRSYATAE